MRSNKTKLRKCTPPPEDTDLFILLLLSNLINEIFQSEESELHDVTYADNQFYAQHKYVNKCDTIKTV